MVSSSPWIANVDTSLAPKLQRELEGQGFVLSQPQYTFFQAKKKGLSCTFYISGKLLVQGKEKDLFITSYLEPEIVGTCSYASPVTEETLLPHIGVDEAGKGDFFGPLCIAAVYGETKGGEVLRNLGIQDSKRLTEKKVFALAQKIKQKCPYALIEIFPKRYNELYQEFRNLNDLLAWGHATAIGEVYEKTGCREVLIDQFAHHKVVERAIEQKGIDVVLTQRFRGEEDLVVAAASILARAAFVEGIQRLGTQFSLLLPKGAARGVVIAGKQFVARHGEEELHQVAKLHFKTTQEVLE